MLNSEIVEEINLAQIRELKATRYIHKKKRLLDILTASGLRILEILLSNFFSLSDNVVD